MQNYHVIGLMSGTSLDGVDLAYCKFIFKNNTWEYQILQTECIHYDQQWKNKLSNAENENALAISKLDVELGKYFAKLINDFIDKNKIANVDFIASHGHTIFHQPEHHLTLQIGSGASISANTGISTVCDFRTMDVSMGGQGAPLVPIGDRDLFSDFDFCLNIGGIANVSYDLNGERLAYDICPANMMLNNYLPDKQSMFDHSGAIARAGSCNHELLIELNKLSYYKQEPPKSLGKEWVLANIYTLISNFKLNNQDILATLVEHIAIQIAANCKNASRNPKVLITGGGAYHNYLIERIKFHTSAQIIIPEAELIEFKEALIFAFLGVLRMRDENNCLASVTGAKKDNCGGAVYLAN